MKLFRASGGLRYHWRAWREQTRWRPFCSELEAWLGAWKISSRELILIGPSGGYTLPTEWLRRFDAIYAFDGDPLARFFFRRRHPGVRVEFNKQDLFWEDGRYSALGLLRVLRQHPDAVVLMSNVLGQLLLEHPASETEWEDFLQHLRTRLGERPWASYHDLYTYEDGEVIDHLMGGPWKEGLLTRQFRWQLTRASHHIIEGVTSP